MPNGKPTSENLSDLLKRVSVSVRIRIQFLTLSMQIHATIEPFQNVTNWEQLLLFSWVITVTGQRCPHVVS